MNLTQNLISCLLFVGVTQGAILNQKDFFSSQSQNTSLAKDFEQELTCFPCVEQDSLPILSAMDSTVCVFPGCSLCESAVSTSESKREQLDAFNEPDFIVKGQQLANEEDDDYSLNLPKLDFIFASNDEDDDESSCSPLFSLDDESNYKDIDSSTDDKSDSDENDDEDYSPVVPKHLPLPTAISIDFYHELQAKLQPHTTLQTLDFLASVSPFGHGLMEAFDLIADGFRDPLDLKQFGNVWNQFGNNCQTYNSKMSYWLCVAWYTFKVAQFKEANYQSPNLETVMIMDSFKATLSQSNLFVNELNGQNAQHLIAIVEATKWHWLTTAASSKSAFASGDLRPISMNEWMNSSYGGRSWYQTIKEMEETSEASFNGWECHENSSSTVYATACLFYERRIRDLDGFSVLDGPILAIDYLLNGLNMEDDKDHPRRTRRFLETLNSEFVSFENWLTYRFANIIPLSRELSWSNQTIHVQNPNTDSGDLEIVNKDTLQFEQQQKQFAYLRSSAKFWFKIMDENGDGYFDTNELLAYVKDAVHSLQSRFDEDESKIAVRRTFNQLRDLIFTHTNAVSLKDLLRNPGSLSLLLNVLFDSSITFKSTKLDHFSMKVLSKLTANSMSFMTFEVLLKNIHKRKSYRDYKINDVADMVDQLGEMPGRYDFIHAAKLYDLLLTYLQHICFLTAQREWPSEVQKSIDFIC